MLATVAAANIKKVQIKKYSFFIYSEAEPHASTVYINRRVHCVFYSTQLQISSFQWRANDLNTWLVQENNLRIMQMLVTCIAYSWACSHSRRVGSPGFCPAASGAVWWNSCQSWWWFSQSPCWKSTGQHGQRPPAMRVGGKDSNIAIMLTCLGLGSKASNLARTHPVCLLERLFPEMLLFGQNVLWRIFSYDFLGVNNQIFYQEIIF